MERTLAKDTLKKIDQKVQLFGWVASLRDHGKITFIDLRDRTGIVQCVGGDLPKVSAESVVAVEGKVSERPKDLVNPNLETGKVEVQIEKLAVISKAKELPFPVDGDGYEIGEEIKLKYRYLDLRRPRLQRNIKVRSSYVAAAREYLFSQDFIEIETPILNKSTPEGSRDFVVPSRLYPGKFFALPQSPQQYKQLLMVAGFERYFQIARCLRDEDPRADRGYEFTQLDLEMSFASENDILDLFEELFTSLAREVRPDLKLVTPFPRVTWHESMRRYGTDKPA